MKEGKKQAKRINKATALHRKVVQKVRKRLSFLDKITFAKALGILSEILEHDVQQQITLLPYYFAQSLGNKKKKIKEDLLIQLGAANVFGWLAYTIYDDFLDSEGDPQLLSIANISLRSVCEIYEKILPKSAEFLAFFHNIMDTLDHANAWEAANCRITIEESRFIFTNFVIPDFQNYTQLAEKSFGHALGALAILFSYGFTKNSPEVRNFLVFFKHYLIARQLNDDAHDWKKDFSRGYCNSVGSLLLKKKYPHQKDISVEEYIQKLQKVFWYEVIEDVCVLVYAHTKKARSALKKCSSLSESTFFEGLLMKYEKAAQSALEEKKKALMFLQTYSLDKKKEASE